MIKKIPGYNIWVLKKTDYRTLCKIASFSWGFIVQVPILGLNVKPLYSSQDSETDYIAVIDVKHVPYPYVNNQLINIKLDLLEAINKRWNEFYD